MCSDEGILDEIDRYTEERNRLIMYLREHQGDTEYSVCSQYRERCRYLTEQLHELKHQCRESEGK